MNNSIVATLLKQYPEKFESILADKNYRVQVIYTQIDRKANNRPLFTDHHFMVDPSQYFYPASTVKFPVAVLALQRLNELNIAGLDMNSTMVTGASFEGQTAVEQDSSSRGLKPSIAHYIKKIFLVSDNDAFNRLYEFLGQEYINQSLHRMGYRDCEIIHRLSISMTEEQNRHTNPVKFYDRGGKMVYEQPLQKSSFEFLPGEIKLGRGFIRDNELVNEPFDFSKKNRVTLPALHNMLRAVMFPRSVPEHQRFNLKPADYKFLYKYMSMHPWESGSPNYDPETFYDTYSKFILYGAEKKPIDEGVRIFNKIGSAYGFLTDVAYVVDYRNNIEFMLSATIHTNSDGIYNDDKYDYATVGFPFMKNLGRVIYEHELERKRKYSPDLSKMKIDYSEQEF